jgi:hypothetical protein
MALLSVRSSRPTSRRKTVLTERPGISDTSTPLGLRPSQQLLRKLGGSMHRLPSRDAPETARIDLGGTRRTRANRRTPFATTGNAKEAVTGAVGALEFAHPLSTTGIMGCTNMPSNIV